MRSERGALLVELMAAVVIFAIAIAGMAALEGSALQARRRALAESLLSDQARLVDTALRDALRDATVVEDPEDQTPGTLTVWRNVHPGDGRTALPDGEAGFSHFCLRPARGDAEGAVFLYEGFGTPPLGQVYCGRPAPRAARMLELGAGAGVRTLLRFRRAEENVLLAECSVTLPRGGPRRPLRVSRRARLSLPRSRR